MKFLLIGDFGGQFSDSLLNKLRSEDFDYILCTGDFANLKKIGELFKKYGENVARILGKEKNKELRVEGVKQAKLPLQKLNSFGKPIYSVRGNNEYREYDLFLDVAKRFKNFNLINCKGVNLNGLSIVGFPTFSSIERKSELGDIYVKFIKNIGNVNAKETIFLTHVPPYNCKLDKLSNKGGLNDGKHIGYKVTERILSKYKFPLVVCGHLEEYQGECMKNNSKIINPGSAAEGKYAILEINKSVKDAKIRFK